MSKDLSGATTTAIAIDAQEKQPVLLFTQFLTFPTLTLRFCAYNTNLIFGGNTFTAKSVIFDGVGQSLEGQIGRVSVKYDNVLTDMTAYAFTQIFEGRRLFIQRIYLDDSGNPPTAATDYVEVFDGTMDTPSEIGREWLTVSATTGKALKKKTLLATYNKGCRHVFGDSFCNLDGLSDQSSFVKTGNLTSTSLTGTTFAGVGVLTQADDYWDFGRITIGKSGTSYNRIVSDFDNATSGGTLDLSLPVSIDSSFRYILYKGCSKILTTCKGEEAYGPSGDNSVNFGGFGHIGKKQEGAL